MLLTKERAEAHDRHGASDGATRAIEPREWLDAARVRAIGAALSRAGQLSKAWREPCEWP